MRHCTLLRLRAIGVGAAASLTLFTAACGGGQAGVAQHLGTPASSGTGVVSVPSTATGEGADAPTDGPQGAGGRVALRAYQDWWAAQIEVDGRSDSSGDQLRLTSSGQALGDALVSLRGLHAAKMVMSGTPRNSPVVKKVDLTSSPQSAEIEDCVDVTGWHQADAADGSIKDPPQRLSRYVARVVLRTIGSSWMVFEFNREAGRTC